MCFFLLFYWWAVQKREQGSEHRKTWAKGESDTFAIEPLDGMCKANYITRMFRLREKNSSHGSGVVNDEEGKNWLPLKWILFSLLSSPNHFHRCSIATQAIETFFFSFLCHFRLTNWGRGEWQTKKKNSNQHQLVLKALHKWEKFR